MTAAVSSSSKTLPRYVDGLQRHLLETGDEVAGLSAVVRLDEADDDVLAAARPAVGLGQHRVGLADAGRVAEEHLEAAALAQRVEREGLERLIRCMLVVGLRLRAAGSSARPACGPAVIRVP